MMNLVFAACIVATLYGVPAASQALSSDVYDVGGIDSDKFPYHVSLEYYGRHMCGGSIISEDIVLTAAHCATYAASNYMIRAGSSKPETSGNVYSVTRVIRHPNFSPWTMDYDYALMHISSVFNIGEDENIASLSAESDIVAPGSVGVIPGWGNISGGSGNAAISVVIASDETCSECSGNLGSQTLCVLPQNGNNAACKGDTGGPLVIDGTLVGVVSWSLICAHPDCGFTCSSIPAVRQWIKNNTGV